MSIAVCILCLAMLAISLICSKDNIYSPASIVSGIWFICICCFNCIDHGLYAITDHFYVAISIWITCFCVGCLCTQSLAWSVPYQNVEPSKVIRNIYLVVCIITLPIMVMHVNAILHSGIEGNVFHVLRMANVQGYEEKGISRTATAFIPFWQITYLIELYFYSAKNRYRVWFLLALNLFYVVVSMSKTVLLMLFLSTMFVLLFNHKIKVKHLLWGGGTLIVVFFVLQLVRSLQGQESSFSNFLRLYLLTGMPAFENIEPCSAKHWGENSFRFIYAVGYRLHLTSIEPIDPILQWTSVPVQTNVYTTLYPFYKDFGLVGLGIFGTILGLFFGWIYKIATQPQSPFAVMLYAIFSICLFMQMIGDVFFTVFSQNLQYFLIAIVPFIITKYHLFKRKGNG